MTNYNQLNIEQRETIQVLLNRGKTFTDIGNAIGKDRTTVSKEIKRNRYIKSYFYDPFDINGINRAIEDCEKLQSKPYVCNTCSNKSHCNKHHLYYEYKIADKHYLEKLVDSRSGIDIKPEIINDIEKQKIRYKKRKHSDYNIKNKRHLKEIYSLLFCKNLN